MCARNKSRLSLKYTEVFCFVDRWCEQRKVLSIKFQFSSIFFDDDRSVAMNQKNASLMFEKMMKFLNYSEMEQDFVSDTKKSETIVTRVHSYSTSLCYHSSLGNEHEKMRLSIIALRDVHK